MEAGRGIRSKVRDVADGMVAPSGPSDSVADLASALLLYAVSAVLTVGFHALPHLGSVCACNGSVDLGSYVWALRWWPHAIATGHNPFFTSNVWSPTGGNVAQAATIPAAALVTAPITLAVGPIVSYNLLSIASPALSAFSAFLLCRRLVGGSRSGVALQRRDVPAIAGGFIYGFGSYEFAQLTEHLNLTLTFAIPLLVLATLMRAEQRLSRRSFVAVMAVLLLTQIGLSTELLVDVVVLGLVLLLAARVSLPSADRSIVDHLLLEVLIAGILAVAIASPFLYYAVIRNGAGTISHAFADILGVDLLNLVVPTRMNVFGGAAFAHVSAAFSAGYQAEADGYLGLPLLAVFALGMRIPARHRLTVRLVALAAILSLVGALGAHLYIEGRRTVPLPFDLVRSLPVLDNLTPNRLIVFTSLAMAVAAALFAASGRGFASVRGLLVGLAALAPFPNLLTQFYGETIRNPRFFTERSYQSRLPLDSTVLILPFGYNDLSMLWQAETGFRFRMPEGYLRASSPPPFDREPAVASMLVNAPPKPAVFRSFLQRHDVHEIVVDPADVGSKLPFGGPMLSPWPGYLRGLGMHGTPVGGVILYHLPVSDLT